MPTTRGGADGTIRRRRIRRRTVSPLTGMASRRDTAARKHGIELEVVKLPEVKRGFVLLPRRWVVERSFAWTTCFRRLVKDYERYASTLADLHLVAFVCLMLRKAALLADSS
ncbi:transposase [Methylorubrum extorquens]